MNLKEKLNPFPNEKTKIYGVISDIDKAQENSYIIKFEIINEKMIEFDKKFIYSERFNKDDNPKDVLYLYFMELEVSQHVFSKFFEKTDNSAYQFELIPIHDENRNINKDEFKCNVYFTASPISVEKYYVKILKEVSEVPMRAPVFNNKPLSSKTEIKEKLDGIFNYSLKANYFRVHNIGQGSCNTILFKQKNKMFYDIGFTRYRNREKRYDILKRNFLNHKFRDYDAVVLSHWDEDHLLGMCLDDSGDILRKKWIVPKVLESPNAKRIAYIVANYGTLIQIDNSVSGEFYHKDDLTLFKASGYGNKDRNNSGIILGINTQKCNLIAMGDASYRYALDCTTTQGNIFQNLDYLIVPHHGADVKDDINFNSKVPMNTSSYSRYASDAIISVGYNPQNYSHPRTSTINDLCNKGFIVIRTDVDGRRCIKF